MGQKICDYCSGSGRDAVTPGTMSCWKCHGMGSYWEADPVPVGRTSAAGTRSAQDRRGGGQYRLLPFMQSLLDGIPRWLKWISAVVTAVLGLGLGQEVDPSADTAMWVFGGLGAVLGYYALPALIVLADATIQLTVVLVKLAIALAILAGVGYAVWLLAS
jgi:hypothetical protein